MGIKFEFIKQIADIVKLYLGKYLDYIFTRKVTLPRELNLKEKSPIEQFLIVLQELKRMVFETIAEVIRLFFLVITIFMFLLGITYAFIMIMESMPDILEISWKSMFIGIAKGELSIFDIIKSVF